VSTTPTTPSPSLTTETPAQVLLGDLIQLGVTAAAIFIKNPASQQRAGTIIAAVSPLVSLFESLI
jgi:hypothetical protein